MKRFVGEIVIEDRELVAPVVKGIETYGNGMEVELYEKEKIDLDRNRVVPDGVTTTLKIYKNEFFD